MVPDERGGGDEEQEVGGGDQQQVSMYEEEKRDRGEGGKLEDSGKMEDSGRMGDREDDGKLEDSGRMGDREDDGRLEDSGRMRNREDAGRLEDSGRMRDREDDGKMEDSRKRRGREDAGRLEDNGTSQLHIYNSPPTASLPDLPQQQQQQQQPLPASEDVAMDLSTKPARSQDQQQHTDPNSSWLGRAACVLTEWSLVLEQVARDRTLELSHLPLAPARCQCAKAKLFNSRLFSLLRSVEDRVERYENLDNNGGNRSSTTNGSSSSSAAANIPMSHFPQREFRCVERLLRTYVTIQIPRDTVASPEAEGIVREAALAAGSAFSPLTLIRNMVAGLVKAVRDQLCTNAVCLNKKGRPVARQQPLPSLAPSPSPASAPSPAPAAAPASPAPASPAPASTAPASPAPASPATSPPAAPTTGPFAKRRWLKAKRRTKLAGVRKYRPGGALLPDTEPRVLQLLETVKKVERVDGLFKAVLWREAYRGELERSVERSSAIIRNKILAKKIGANNS